MEIKDWISLGVSVSGFALTIIVMLLQFRNAEDTKNKDEKRKVYYECYEIIERIIINKELMFDQKYYDQLQSFQAKIKIIGGNEVVNSYGDFLKIINDKLYAYKEYQKQNDPENNPAYYKYEIDEFGIENSSFMGSEEDINIFEKKLESYRNEHNLDKKTLTKKVDSLLNLMRLDIGNNKFERKKMLK